MSAAAHHHPPLCFCRMLDELTCVCTLLYCIVYDECMHTSSIIGGLGLGNNDQPAKGATTVTPLLMPSPQLMRRQCSLQAARRDRPLRLNTRVFTDRLREVSRTGCCIGRQYALSSASASCQSPRLSAVTGCAAAVRMGPGGYGNTVGMRFVKILFACHRAPSDRGAHWHLSYAILHRDQ